LKENVAVCVYDMGGRKIILRESHNLHNDPLRIDARGLDPGLFIVCVRSADLERCIKIIKN
jgi:hypothetical protein